MVCPTIDTLRHLLDEQLEPAKRNELAEHVARCERCQKTLDDMTSDTFLQRVGVCRDRAAAQPLEPALSELLTQLPRNPPELERGSCTTATDLEEPTQPSVDPQAPMSFSDFHLQSVLGSGGMGTVHRAMQKSLNKPVAVKVLRSPSDRDSHVVQRFLREACSAASLRHPNIVDVHGIGRTPDGGYFLVMDLVDGTDLERCVDSDELQLSQVPALVAAIADAVQHAHEHAVIHRDLKPSNVLIDADRRVMVTDFGIAKVLGGNEAQLTRPELLLGTPCYMAPEQIDRRWGEVGPKTDVYGLGGILYFLLTRRHPLDPGQHTAFEVLERVVSDRPHDRPSAVRADVPEPLEAVCAKCLQKDPAQRYSAAREVAEALRNFATGEDAGDADRTQSRAVRPTKKPTHRQQLETKGTGEATVEISLEQQEPPLGAIPLDSSFYLPRDADRDFQSAVSRGDSIVLIRGARQVGKTSLLARGLKQARESGMNVVLSDFQKLNAADLESVERLFLALGQWIADALDLDVLPDDVWNSRRGPSVNFERYLRREVLGKVSSPVVWALDEVDRLFVCDYSSEVFGLFRSWHNERALDPAGPWSNFTLVIAYATEAHLFITDMNQSPFNVGTRFSLQDFTPQQVRKLNGRYGMPLRTDAEIGRFYDLLAGHPYLTNRGLYEMATHGMDMATFEHQAGSNEGFFGDHLRRIVVLLSQDTELGDAVSAVLDGRPCPSPEMFYRLRSAGVMSGDSARDARLRCQLYSAYLTRQSST